MKINRIYYFTMSCVLGLFLSCNKVKNHPIPSLPFEVSVDMSLPSYSYLNSVGGWAYVSGGIKGIVVYRQSYDVFVAWERQSPEDAENKCVTGLETDTNNYLILNDPCSTAQFSLYDGSPIKDSKWGLRMYQVIWNGSNVLRISN